MEIPWLTICSTPPWSPWMDSPKIPMTTKPRWATDEYATSRLRSFCMVATRAP